MIKIVFTKRDGFVAKVEVSGHSGYAAEGSDIVCSAVSSVLWAATNGLTSVLAIPLDICEKDGYVSYEIPMLDYDTRAKADVIIESMKLFFLELKAKYAEFVEVTEV